MAKNQPNDEIRALVDGFAAQLSEIMRRMALEQVVEALGQAAPAGRAGARKGRRKAAGRKQGAGRKKTRAGRGAKGGKRSAAQLDALQGKLLTFIKKNPGQRGEQISAALKTDTPVLRLPLQKLIAEKKVKTKGQRRGTTYFAA